MKKELCFALIIIGLIIFSGIVIAEEETAQIDKAYGCLKDRITETTSLSLEESVFSVLALGNNNKAVKKIEEMKSSSEACWPKSGCTIKETAQVALAYDRIGKNTNDLTKWLLSKNGTASGLIWFLQIITEDNKPDTCDVSYDGGTYTFAIGEDMKLKGVGGNCLSVDSKGYWLRISNNCVNKEFVVSCDKGFKTNLLYTKGAGGTIYVSSETHGAAAKGTTTEKIGAQCFLVGGSCDYESTLWAATAVYAITGETGDFIPYLKSLASEYEKYFPSAFLVYMTQESDEHYQYIIENKNRGGYWQFGADKYFDTSLAMLALSDTDIRSQGTVDYLLTGAGKQTEKGCWNSDNIRDTAFILYSGSWVMAVDGNGGTGGDVPDNPSSATCNNGEIESNEVCECGDDEECGNADDDLDDENCTSLGFESGDLFCKDGCTNFDKGDCAGEENYNPNTITACELDNYCVSGIFDCRDAGGNILPDDTYPCETWDKVCCTVDAAANLEMCSDLDGSVCGFDEECSGSAVEAADGTCCKGVCAAVSEENECANSGGTCKTVCGNDEESSSYSCLDSGKICCASSGETDTSGGISKWWIIILVILILLVLLGIIFRNKLRVWWFKFRGNARSQRIGGGAPPGSLGRMMPRPIPRFGFGQPPRAPIGRAPVRQVSSAKDKEMEETMKKLKKMSE